LLRVLVCFLRQLAPLLLSQHQHPHHSLLFFLHVFFPLPRAQDILKKMAGRPHIMNLGHGIEPTTPEPSANLFVKTVQGWRN